MAAAAFSCLALKRLYSMQRVWVLHTNDGTGKRPLNDEMLRCIRVVLFFGERPICSRYKGRKIPRKRFLNDLGAIKSKAPADRVQAKL